MLTLDTIGLYSVVVLEVVFVVVAEAVTGHCHCGSMLVATADGILSSRLVNA